MQLALIGAFVVLVLFVWTVLPPALPESETLVAFRCLRFCDETQVEKRHHETEGTVERAGYWVCAPESHHTVHPCPAWRQVIKSWSKVSRVVNTSLHRMYMDRIKTSTCIKM